MKPRDLQKQRVASNQHYYANRERLLTERAAKKAALLPEERAALDERRRELTQQNRKRLTEQAREWRRANPDNVKAWKAKYALNSRAKVYAQQQRWRDKNRDHVRAKKKIYFWNIRLEMIAAYGGSCTCCGEDTPEFLTIDHIYNDGKQERAGQKHMTGVRFYMQLRKRGWPKDRYQLLCFNCNFTKAHYGACPHQRLAEKRA